MQEEQRRLAMAIPPGAASPRGADRQQQQQQAPPSQPIPIPISIPASINNNNSGGDNNNSFSTNSSGNNNGGGGGGGVGVLLPPPSPGAATLAARSPLFPFLRPVLSPRRPPYSQWTPPSSPAQWLIGSPPSSPGGYLLSSSPYSYSSFPSSSSYSSTSSSSSSPLRCAVEVFSFDRSCEGAGGAVAGFVGVGVAVAGPGGSGGGSGGSPPRPRGCDKCTQTGGELQPAAAAAERRRQPQHSATAPGSLRQALHSDSDWEPAEASLGGEAIPDVIPPRERSLSESAINPRMERVGQELRRIGDEFNVFVDGQLQRRNFGRQNGRLLHDEAVWLLRFGLYIINRRNL
ncbi:uncharacterized protein LOC116939468 isoform X2 [Petromyzon marinus]|uniref:Trithorax group protein osa-like isoform X2 n=1 Tax=Petromyzon marinus TaxID=7757 RepID=A0AAJ7SQS0_PETMA|nr:trithorax group protein osa-like isoform X2 [Petromyzon marinus]